MLEVARPDEHGEAMGREILPGLTTDSFVSPGDQGNGFVLHSNLFFASSSHQFLIEFLKSRIILTINSTRMRVLRCSIFRSAGRFWHGNLVVLDIL
jgi:hypothetical protein